MNNIFAPYGNVHTEPPVYIVDGYGGFLPAHAQGQAGAYAGWNAWNNLPHGQGYSIQGYRPCNLNLNVNGPVLSPIVGQVYPLQGQRPQRLIIHQWARPPQRLWLNQPVLAGHGLAAPPDGNAVHVFIGHRPPNHLGRTI